MNKTLELNFDAEKGPVKVSIRNPKNPVSPVEIKTAMEKMVQANIFTTTNGDLVAVKSARLVDRSTQDIELF